MTATGGPARSPLRRLPRRAVGAIGRLLRMPAQETLRHEEAIALQRDTLAAVSALQASVDGRLVAVLAELGRLSDELQANRERLELAPLRFAAETEERFRAITAHHSEALRRVASTVAAIADHVASSDTAIVEDSALVSIVLPVRDRSDVLVRALASVQRQTYGRWECIVIDDGSIDDVEKVVSGVEDDRIRVIRQARSGVGAARNAGLAAATGDLVTFLDSDNEWFPSRLAHIVSTMVSAEWAQWAIDGQLIDDAGGALPYVRDLRLPLSTLDRANFIDLGSIVVRRELFDAVGGFDPELERLGDWDLIRRLAAVVPPLRLPTIGVRYHDERSDRISRSAALGPAAHRIRRRAIGSPAAGLKVLLAEWHYPQITETYVEADLQGLRLLGASVDVWSEQDVAVSFEPDVPVHRGDLADAIEATRPDLVLSHWLHTGLIHRATTKAAGVPHVVRAHGFDFDGGVVDELLRDRDVVLHLFPHQVGRWTGHPRLSPQPVSFDPSRYRPTEAKDRRLVVRTVAGLLTKDVEVFWETARRCPDHRFVLVVGHAYQTEHTTEELIEAAASSAAPVEIRTDVDFSGIAALVAEAGIYLHTHGTSHPFGMSISVAEAMATGAYVVARDIPGVSAYLGEAGVLYRGQSVEERADHAAALINATLRWEDERWRHEWLAALDNAWSRFPADLVMADQLAAWRELLGVRAP